MFPLLLQICLTVAVFQVANLMPSGTL